MTVLRTGSNRKFAAGWALAFGKKKSGKKPAAKKKTASRKKSK
jgi:hypothetical protein